MQTIHQQVIHEIQQIPAANLVSLYDIIGIVASQGVDFLLTWNFKHINNANNRTKIAEVLSKLNYPNPIICSPEELISER